MILINDRLLFLLIHRVLAFFSCLESKFINKMTPKRYGCKECGKYFRKYNTSKRSHKNTHRRKAFQV